MFPVWSKVLLRTAATSDLLFERLMNLHLNYMSLLFVLLIVTYHCYCRIDSAVCFSPPVICIRNKLSENRL